MKKFFFDFGFISRLMWLDITIWLAAVLLLVLTLMVARPNDSAEAAASPESSVSSAGALEADDTYLVPPRINDQSSRSTGGQALAPFQEPSVTPSPTDDPYPFGTPTQTDYPTATYDPAYPGPGTSVGPTSTSASGTQAPNPTSTATSSSPTPSSRTLTPAPTTFGQATATTSTTGSDSAAQLTQPAAGVAGETFYQPLPSVTIIFPTRTVEGTLLQGERPPEYAALKKRSDSSRFTLSRIGPIAFVLLIWVLLGGWFYFSARHIS